MEFNTDKDFASELDRKDPLNKFRDKFYIPISQNGEEALYFAGNSLGLQPKSVQDYILQELTDWKNLGVLGHHQAKYPWLPYHEFLTKQTAEIVGAKAHEVINMNSLTVNLHLLMVSFYRPQKNKFKILIEANAFPSDHYAVQSQLKFHGYDPEEGIIEAKPRGNQNYINPQDIIDIIDRYGDSIALIMLSGVNYYTGQVFDMEQITAAGHSKGCFVGFDLAHAAGNILLELNKWNCDFAAWCSYKYLNGGPGAVAGAYINERYVNDSNIPKFWGWWGQDKSARFDMEHKFIPIPSAESWQLSNPPILQLASLRASLDIFKHAGMTNLRNKSVLLTAYLEFLIEQINNPDIEIITPKNPQQRGAQLSLKISNNGKNLHNYLLNNGVICDWRKPDVIRIAPVPLYNSFCDVWKFYEILKNYS
jgi:kynureninase